MIYKEDFSNDAGDVYILQITRKYNSYLVYWTIESDSLHCHQNLIFHKLEQKHTT